MGNFDNTASHALVGAQASAPLLFDLLEAVEDRSHVRPTPSTPQELIPVKVCADSGYAPTPACPKTELTLALERAVPTQLCPLHHRVEVDVDTHEAVNAQCRAGRHTAWKAYSVWPAAVQRWYALQGRTQEPVPKLAAACRVEERREALWVVSPAPGQVAMLLPGLAPERQEVPLEADGDVGGSELSWFVDAQFVGRAPAQQTLYWKPSLGLHRLVVQSQSGQTATAELEVRQRPL